MDPLAYADELARRDALVAAATAEVAEAQQRVEVVRERAAATAGFLAALPERRAEAAAAVTAAAADLDERRRELALAEDELARAQQARKDDEVADARRRVSLARDLAAAAERKLARAQHELTELEREAARAEEEVAWLEREAREVAAVLRALPRVSASGAADPEPDLDGVAEWASRARAALFVARGGLDREREQVVREANELGAAVLGEPLAATSVALVRDRIARALA